MNRSVESHSDGCFFNRLQHLIVVIFGVTIILFKFKIFKFALSIFY